MSSEICHYNVARPQLHEELLDEFQWCIERHSEWRLGMKKNETMSLLILDNKLTWSMYMPKSKLSRSMNGVSREMVEALAPRRIALLEALK